MKKPVHSSHGGSSFNSFKIHKIRNTVFPITHKMRIPMHRFRKCTHRFSNRTFLVRTDFVMDGIPLVKRWLSSASRLRMQTTQARQIVRVTPLAQDRIMHTRNKEKNFFRYNFCRLRLRTSQNDVAYLVAQDKHHPKQKQRL